MNTITIELCAEDRARLDAILDALTNHRNCSKCIESVATCAANTAADVVAKSQPVSELAVADAIAEPLARAAETVAGDPVVQVAKAVEQAFGQAAEALKTAADQSFPPDLEGPFPDAQDLAEAPAPVVDDHQYTVAELQHEVGVCITAGKKKEAREIVREYSPNVSGVPEEKRGELVAKLRALVA